MKTCEKNWWFLIFDQWKLEKITRWFWIWPPFLLTLVILLLFDQIYFSLFREFHGRLPHVLVTNKKELPYFPIWYFFENGHHKCMIFFGLSTLFWKWKLRNVWYLIIMTPSKRCLFESLERFRCHQMRERDESFRTPSSNPKRTVLRRVKTV